MHTVLFVVHSIQYRNRRAMREQRKKKKKRWNRRRRCKHNERRKEWKRETIAMAGELCASNVFVENEWVSEQTSGRLYGWMDNVIALVCVWVCMFLYMISVRNRISSKLIENLRQWYTADIIMYQWLTNTESNFEAFSECVVTSTWVLSGNESELYYYYTQYGYINWESRNEISFLITMSILIAREPLSV